MSIFETVTYAIIKRPFILVLIGVLMLLAAVFNVFIPIMAMIMGIVNLTGGGVFDAILSVLQMLIDPAVLPTLLLLLAGGTLLVGIAAGLLLPGYLLIVGDGLQQGEKKKGLFLEGLKEHFFRFFLIAVKTVLSTAGIAVFLMVSSVPAIVVTKAAFSTRPNLMVAAVFIDLVTVGVLFMSLSFFKTYVYMWFLAAANRNPKPFRYGKSLADRGFWKLALGLFCFDLVFAGAIFAIYLSDSQIFRYGAGWVFTTCFFSILAVYLVQSYYELSTKSEEKSAVREKVEE